MTPALSDAFATHADRSSTYIALLEGFASFEAPGGGWVRYADASGVWLGATEPIAPPAERVQVATAFAAAAQAAGRRAALLPVTEGLATALAAARWHTQLVGQEPVFELRPLYADGADPLLLRPRVRGLLKKGVRVDLVEGAALEADTTARAVVADVHARCRRTCALRPLLS